MGCGCAKRKKDKASRPYNIVNVVMDHITGNAEYVDDEVAKQRLSICQVCPHKEKLGPFDICGICKCLLKEKVKYTKSQCPDGPDGCELANCPKKPRW